MKIILQSTINNEKRDELDKDREPTDEPGRACIWCVCVIIGLLWWEVLRACVYSAHLCAAS